MIQYLHFLYFIILLDNVFKGRYYTSTHYLSARVLLLNVFIWQLLERIDPIYKTRKKHCLQEKNIQRNIVDAHSVIDSGEKNFRPLSPLLVSCHQGPLNVICSVPVSPLSNHCHQTGQGKKWNCLIYHHRPQVGFLHLDNVC